MGRNRNRESRTEPLPEANTSMRARWTRWLPGFPAVLLIPAIVVGWALLLWVPEGYALWELEEPWSSHRGFPVAFERIFRGQATRYDPPSGLVRRIWFSTMSDFRISYFLIDLAIALAVAYLLALAVDRRLFPLVRRLYRKNPEPGEPN